jgi:hypothetical protein
LSAVEDYAERFEAFLKQYMVDYERDLKNGHAYMGDDLEAVKEEVTSWFRDGMTAIDAVEPGLKEACQAYVRGLNEDASNDDADGLAEFMIKTTLVIAPVWLHDYRRVRPIIEAYRAATAQSPL